MVFTCAFYFRYFNASTGLEILIILRHYFKQVSKLLKFKCFKSGDLFFEIKPRSEQSSNVVNDALKHKVEENTATLTQRLSEELTIGSSKDISSQDTFDAF